MAARPARPTRTWRRGSIGRCAIRSRRSSAATSPARSSRPATARASTRAIRRCLRYAIVDPQAGAHAASLDGQRGDGALLQGAVIVVKDNIDTAGLATTAGSLAIAMNEPANDAFVVDRLHEAHGLVLGKTNLSEWANFRGTASISGWSSLGGQTYNGKNAGYNPCGSSAGSAAAVAAGLASAALGTETNGSITCPSSINGVVGFKPTVGLVSRTGVMPISATQDTVGPITKTVGDAARVLTAIAGPDANDPATRGIPTSMSLDFEAPLAAATLSGKRFGVVASGSARRSMRSSTPSARAWRRPARRSSTSRSDTWGNDEFTMLLYEFKDGVNAYLAAHPVAGQPATLADLIAYNQRERGDGDAVLRSGDLHAGRGDDRARDARVLVGEAARARRRRDQRHRRRHDREPARRADLADRGPRVEDRFASGDPSIRTSSGPAAIAGYPHLTVPMGQVGGLPVGMSFFGHAGTTRRCSPSATRTSSSRRSRKFARRAPRP